MPGTSLPCLALPVCATARAILWLLALASLAASPAHAGHWVLDASGSTAGVTSSPTDPNPPSWQAPASTNTGSITLPAISEQQGGPDGKDGDSVTATAKMTVSVTGTWTIDGKSDDTTPPSVMVYVMSTATSAQSSGSDFSVGPVTDGINVNKPDPKTRIVADNEYITPSTPGSFKIPLMLSASATASPAAGGPGTPVTDSATASVGQVTVTVHAQPYNLH